MKTTSLGIVASVLIAGASATGQPLVTGGLSVYYDFDEVREENFIFYVPDESGNGLDGEIGEVNFLDANFDLEPDIALDTQDFMRGTGSIAFNTDNSEKDDFIAIGSCYPQVLGLPCEVPSELVPSEAITIATWLQAKPVDEPGAAQVDDMSIYQSRSELGSFVHTQLQSNGSIRLHLRGQDQSPTITGPRLYTDGSTDNVDASFPRGEWFHWAATYDANTDLWAMYYNGEEIGSGFADTVGEPVGDWGQGALLGLVPDVNRQFVGKMDEFYVFTRALSAEEIAVLALVDGGTGLAGDFNGNDLVEQADLDLVLLNWGDTLADPASDGWINDFPEGAIDQAELDKVLLNWGNAPDMMATAAGVPEPGTAALGALMILLLAPKLRRRP